MLGAFNINKDIDTPYFCITHTYQQRKTMSIQISVTLHRGVARAAFDITGIEKKKKTTLEAYLSYQHLQTAFLAISWSSSIISRNAFSDRFDNPCLHVQYKNLIAPFWCTLRGAHQVNLVEPCSYFGQTQSNQNTYPAEAH